MIMPVHLQEEQENEAEEEGHDSDEVNNEWKEDVHTMEKHVLVVEMRSQVHCHVDVVDVVVDAAGDVV